MIILSHFPGQSVTAKTMLTNVIFSPLICPADRHTDDSRNNILGGGNYKHHYWPQLAVLFLLVQYHKKSDPQPQRDWSEASREAERTPAVSHQGATMLMYVTTPSPTTCNVTVFHSSLCGIVVAEWRLHRHSISPRTSSEPRLSGCLSFG